MRQEDRARELTRQQHKDMLAKEHRSLDLQERQLEQGHQQGERVAKMEEQIQHLASKTDDLFAFLKSKLGA